MTDATPPKHALKAERMALQKNKQASAACLFFQRVTSLQNVYAIPIDTTG